MRETLGTCLQLVNLFNGALTEALPFGGIDILLDGGAPSYPSSAQRSDSRSGGGGASSRDDDGRERRLELTAARWAALGE